MEILRFGYKQIPESDEPISMSLGTFDGFHEGHAHLAMLSRYEGRYINSILLFSNPPSLYIDNKKEEAILSSLEQKLRHASLNRYEKAFVIETDEEFFGLPREEFEKILKDLNVKEIFVGEDFRYGKNAEGNPSTLKESGFDVHIVPIKTQEGLKISSSFIRKSLLEGEIEKANAQLGYPYEFEGTVIEGKKIGRTIGFPTLNLKLDYNNIIPKLGVYAGLVYVRGRPYKAMISIGNNPTVKGEALSIEGHLLDFDEEIYGRHVTFAFLHRIRDIKTFDGLESLKAQLQKDKETLLDLLEE